MPVSDEMLAESLAYAAESKFKDQLLTNDIFVSIGEAQGTCREDFRFSEELWY
ncbi:MAG: hypothetical protein ACJ72J_17935 [Nitrososphaeraceae archaeon]